MSKGKKTGFGVMLVVLVLIMAFLEFVVPKIVADEAEAVVFPKLDRQYVKTGVYEGGTLRAFDLSEDEQDTLMKYINFSGRKWTDDTAEPSPKYLVEVNENQQFMIEPVASDGVKAKLWFKNTDSEGTKTYSAEASGNLAAQLLLVLQDK